MIEKGWFKGLSDMAEEHIPAETTIWPEVKARVNARKTEPTGTLGRRWAWAMAVIGLVLALVLFNVPAVKARLEKVEDIIAGVLFSQTGEFPAADGEVSLAPTETRPLSQVQGQYGFGYPEWAPAGYELAQEVSLIWFAGYETPNIQLSWVNVSENSRITLSISDPAIHLVGPSAVETLEINGREVAYWVGGWDNDQQIWNENLQVQSMSVQIDGMDYVLTSPESVSPEDQLQMMGSLLE